MFSQNGEWPALLASYCGTCMKTVTFGKRQDQEGRIYYVCLGNARCMGGDGCGRRVEIVDGGCKPQAPVHGRGCIRG